MEAATLCLILVVLLTGYLISIITKKMFHELMKHYKFIVFYYKLELFNKNYHNEAEYLLHKAHLRFKPLRFMTTCIIKIILLKKWSEYIEHSDKKLLSNLNFSLRKILLFEDSNFIKKRIVRYVMNHKDVFVSEIDAFKKMEKAYVIEQFVDILPITKEAMPMLNHINEVVFQKALFFALNTKKTNEPILHLLDTDQQTRVKMFAQMS